MASSGSTFRSDQLSCIHPTSSGQQFHDVQFATKLWTTLCGAAAIQRGPDLRFQKGEANATKGWNMMNTYDFHRRGLLRTLLVQCLWNWWPMRKFLHAFIEMKWFKGYYWYMMVHSNANTQEVPLEMSSANGPSFLHSIAQALQTFATVSCGMFTRQSRWFGKANEGQFEKITIPCVDHHEILSCSHVMPSCLNVQGKNRVTFVMKTESQDIYYSSLEFGPENIRSAPSYFHMGRVFQSWRLKGPGTRFYGPQNLWWYGLHINKNT